MLEFLFNFIEHNIFLIFLFVLILGIASAYSKSTRFLFLSLLGIAVSYFALLCLYRLGIGIDFLYDWSCKWVVTICNQIDYYSIFCLNHSILFSKLIEFLFAHSYSDLLLALLHITMIFTLIFVIIEVVIPRLKPIAFKKIKNNAKRINKITVFYNTINSTQSK
ncbi:MAG: hypothetical protein K2J85_02940, partial [Anaeroplasmataceae bacterium]|nr:hypothetical protein [Anaeroplasmataceae bacterium]